MLNCLILLRQLIRWDLLLALASAGSIKLARRPIIAMTTSNSTRVKPAIRWPRGVLRAFMTSTRKISRLQGEQLAYRSGGRERIVPAAMDQAYAQAFARLKLAN